LYWLNWGIAIAARMPMIAITISNSIRVKPLPLSLVQLNLGNIFSTSLTKTG